jgi:HEAT repeat protein
MDVALLVLGLGLFPAFVGCNGLGIAGLSAIPSQKNAASPDASKTPVADRHDSNAAKPDGIATGDRAVFESAVEKDAQGRERCVWTRSMNPQSPFRWQYPKLDAVLNQPTEQRPDLPKLLADREKKVAFNAAIALGRAGDARAIGPLNKAIQTATLPMPMRLAAAEAIAIPAANLDAKTDEAAVQIKKLLDQYGEYSPKSTSYIAELHEELLRGLARREDAAADSRFIAALKSPRAEVRLEALKAWTASKGGKLPVEAIDLRTDGDARVRAEALHAIVAQRVPQALDHLQNGLNDNDFTVRRAALAGLGAWGGSEAQAILEEQGINRSDGVRAEVVNAFAAMKNEKAILGFAGDVSWRVRGKVAAALAAFSDDAAVAAVEKLLGDPSAEVQAAAIRALDAWPLERSGPVLLSAMSSTAFSTRKAAARQLAERWPAALKFPVDGPTDRRAKILRELESEFGSRGNRVKSTEKESIARTIQNRNIIKPQEVAKVEAMLEAGDTEALVAYGPALIDVLEAIRFERKQTLPESVYRDVLPKLSPEFAALDRLVLRDVAERRSAARDFQVLAAKQTYRRLTLDRLTQLMAKETDDLVWLGVLQALTNENQAEAADTIYAALGHASSEVRHKACLYLAAHPDRRHAPLLIPALDDSQPLVVCAAAEALGASGMDDTGPLKNLMNADGEDIQFAAACALAQLNDPSGKPALERLAYSKDPQMRARVARAMGDYPDPAFLPILIHDLGDQAAVARAALKSLPQVVGKDVSQPADAQPASIAARISLWKRWYERQ